MVTMMISLTIPTSTPKNEGKLEGGTPVTEQECRDVRELYVSVAL